MTDLLNGKICVVTGGSRGIGRAIALTLARNGACVTVNYWNSRQAAEEVVHEIEQMGGQSIIVHANVVSIKGANRLIDTTLVHFGRLDVLINNVGPFFMKTVADTSFEEWQSMLDGNLNSGFYCTKFALPIMREQKSGHIIFIGAPKSNTTRARQNTCAYGIAKTGVVLLAKTLVREEGGNGIRANVVNPGFIDTGSMTEEDRRRTHEQIAVGRAGKPDDIAGAVLFLLSPQGNYCNGSVIDVDGGLWL